MARRGHGPRVFVAADGDVKEAMGMTVFLGPDAFADVAEATRREWLETNGLGATP